LHQAQLPVIAFHLGVQPNGEEITMSRSRNSAASEALQNPLPGASLNLWGSELTEDILKLARNRVLDGGNLSTRKDLPKRVVKIALIATQALNPHEVLYQGEAAILYGLSPATVSSRQNTGELHVKVNIGK
jgi:hypothetical protein